MFREILQEKLFQLKNISVPPLGNAEHTSIKKTISHQLGQVESRGPDSDSDTAALRGLLPPVTLRIWDKALGQGSGPGILGRTLRTTLGLDSAF